MKLLPDALMPYAKAWVSLLGAIASAVIVAVPAAPQWLIIVAGVLTAAGVYLTPNEHPESDESDPASGA